MAGCRDSRGDDKILGITFGTDGWRDVIGDGFTFENVRAVTRALGDYCLSTTAETPLVVVGYDTRFMSDRFAAVAASQLASQGVSVLLAQEVTPTPALSYAVVHHKATAGLMVTASHNPARYNGLKVKAGYGGSATPDIMLQIESFFKLGPQSGGSEPRDIEEYIDSGMVKVEDLKSAYMSAVISLLDVDPFRARAPKVLVDPLYGAGQGYLKELLETLGAQVDEIHDRPLSTFGGLNPEPIEANLTELKREVVAGGYDLGLALDGDADRIGAVTEKGEFVSSHRIFAVLLRHLVEKRSLRGLVVKTVSTTSMVDALSERYGLALAETPIGFKYICEEILAGDVLIGGEESGGLYTKGHIPERDGMFIGAIFLEAVLAAGKSASALIGDLMDDLGWHHYDRLDVEISGDQRAVINAAMATLRPRTLCSRAVVDVNTRDGVKYILADGSWLILRPSGTEPLVRIYAEASDPESVAALIKVGRDLIMQTCREVKIDDR